jgi:hypothetical protein
MSDVEKLEPGQCWSYLWVGGGGRGIPFHGTNAYRTEKSGSGSGSSHATFYPTICIPGRQELFPPTYSACIPLIYRSYFPSKFAFHGDKLFPPTYVQCMHSF